MYTANKPLHALLQKHSIPSDNFLEQLDSALSDRIIDLSFPDQGADSVVFFITTQKSHSYAVKVGTDVARDIAALTILKPRKLAFVQSIIWSGKINETYVLVTEKLNTPQLKDVGNRKPAYYFSIIDSARKLHQITNPQAGTIQDCLEGRGLSWKSYLLSKYDGRNPYFNWDEICKRKDVDANLTKKTIQHVIQHISQLFEPNNYCFAHTDLNYHNVFVNPKTQKVHTIIDFTESVFGDPLYDFARIRQKIHLTEPKHEDYFRSLLGFSEDESKLEQFYFDMWMLDYVNWYSESSDPDLEKVTEYLRSQFS